MQGTLKFNKKMQVIGKLTERLRALRQPALLSEGLSISA
jgi:hypothetical protein